MQETFNQRQNRVRLITCGVEQIKQERSLVSLFNPNHFLRDVLWRRAHTTHCQEDVVLQEITSQYLGSVKLKVIR